MSRPSTRLTPSVPIAAAVPAAVPERNIRYYPSITMLPEEIIIEVLRNAAPADIRQFRLTCKAYRDIPLRAVLHPQEWWLLDEVRRIRSLPAWQRPFHCRPPRRWSYNGENILVPPDLCNPIECAACPGTDDDWGGDYDHDRERVFSEGFAAAAGQTCSRRYEMNAHGQQFHDAFDSIGCEFLAVDMCGAYNVSPLCEHHHKEFVADHVDQELEYSEEDILRDGDCTQQLERATAQARADASKREEARWDVAEAKPYFDTLYDFAKQWEGDASTVSGEHYASCGAPEQSFHRTPPGIDADDLAIVLAAGILCNTVSPCLSCPLL